ncbi:MAG TPA: hypothetical protein VJA94_07735 [Candidatus Angelobacter sp.]
MMVTFTSAIVVAFMVSWFLASVAVQVAYLFAGKSGRTGFLKFCHRWDHLGLLPRWTFFSMVPDFDFVIAYRVRMLDGSLSEWHIVEMPARPAFQFLWNPGRRKRKAVDDLCLALRHSLAVQLRKHEPSSPITFRFPRLEHYVSQIGSPCGEARQFMILKIFGNSQKSAEILFVSAPFRVAESATQEIPGVLVRRNADAPHVGPGARPCHS